MKSTDFFVRGFTTVVRIVIPLFSLITVFSASVNLFSKKRVRYKSVLLSENNEIEIRNSENLVGSDKKCDICLSGTEKFHAVISYRKGGYTVRPLDDNDVYINGRKITKETAVTSYDNLKIGDNQYNIKLKAINKDKKLPKAKDIVLPLSSLILLQIFIAFSLFFADKENALIPVSGFLFLIVSEWIYMAVRKKSVNLEIEIIVLFLVTIGLFVAARVSSFSMLKEEISFFIGCAIAVAFEKTLKNLKLAVNLQIPAMLVGMGLFIINIVLGTVYNGSKNWVEISSFQFQPSEFIKVILVFVAATTLERAVAKKGLLPFSLFSVFSVAVLIYLRDFGTALVYFCVFTVTVFLRLCDVKLIVAALSLAVTGAFCAIKFIPYVGGRFSSFTHAWENAATSGYQQTRTMVAVGSGGLFGVGAGNGYLKNIAAYDTDIVFGFVSEELGLIVAVTVALCFALLAFYAAKCLSHSTSVFYSIGASAVAVVFIVQAALNIFGSLDMLPFTGVTLPFVSNGGSSLLSCTVMTAFFKAAGFRRIIKITENDEEVEI